MGRRSEVVVPIAAAQLDVIAKARRLVEVFELQGGQAAFACLGDLQLSIAAFDRAWCDAVDRVTRA